MGYYMTHINFRPYSNQPSHRRFERYLVWRLTQSSLVICVLLRLGCFVSCLHSEMALERQKNGCMNSLLEENKALLVELNDLENINKGKCNIKSTHCFFPWCHTTVNCRVNSVKVIFGNWTLCKKSEIRPRIDIDIKLGRERKRDRGRARER